MSKQGDTRYIYKGSGVIPFKGKKYRWGDVLPTGLPKETIAALKNRLPKVIETVDNVKAQPAVESLETTIEVLEKELVARCAEITELKKIKAAHADLEQHVLALRGKSEETRNLIKYVKG